MTVGMCELREPRVSEFEVLVNGVVVKETASIRKATEFIVRYNEVSDLMNERRARARREHRALEVRDGVIGYLKENHVRFGDHPLFVATKDWFVGEFD